MKHWQATRGYFWEEAPFFRLLAPLLPAIMLYDHGFLSARHPGWVVLALAGTLLAGTVLFLINSQNFPVKVLRITVLALAVFMAGWYACMETDIRNDPEWFGHYRDGTVYQAEVMSPPAERNSTWKVPVVLREVFRDGMVQEVRGPALLYIFKDSGRVTLQPGDRLLLPAKWTAITNPGNPNEFDHATYCRRNNILYQQFLSRDELERYRPEGVENQTSVTRKTHRLAMSALGQHLRDEKVRGLMEAMILGEEAHFDPGLRQQYSETGVVHIVAISGSHVVVFFQFISLLFFWIRNKRYVLLKYLFALPLVCFYVAVAGAPTSAVRAAIMFAVLALGIMFQRDRQPLNQLLATAFFMLLYNPMWLFAVGFQLSFIAVLSLMLFYRPIIRLVPNLPVPLRPLWQALAASMAAEILIAPLVAYYFHLLPASFLVANLFAYLFMSFVLIGGLLLILFSKLSAVASGLAFLLEAVVGFFNELVAVLQGWNPQAWQHLQLTLIQLLLLYLLIGWAMAFLFYLRKSFLVYFLLSASLFMMTLIQSEWSALRQQKLIVYNISRRDHAELLIGKRHYRIPDSGADQDAGHFAVHANHIASRAWRRGTAPVQRLLKLGGHNILFLHRQPTAGSGPPFRVDYLVVCYPARRYEALRLRQLFGFQKLVLGSSQKRYVAQMWKDSCQAQGIPAHIVGLDGAFVLSAN